jgi:hypothetical protein
VLPVGHAWQLGFGTVELPPAEKVPTLQSVQVVPPVPGLQMRTAAWWRVGWSLCWSLCVVAWKENKLCCSGS